MGAVQVRGQRLITASQFQTQPRDHPPGLSVAPGPKRWEGWMGRSPGCHMLTLAHYLLVSPLSGARTALPLGEFVEFWGQNYPWLQATSAGRHVVPSQALTQHSRGHRLSCCCVLLRLWAICTNHSPEPAPGIPFQDFILIRIQGETFSPKRFLILLIIPAFPSSEALLGLKQ